MKRTRTANRETRWGKRLKALWPALPTRHPFKLEVLEPRQLLSADALPAAVVTTDQLDYAPGQTAIITAFNSGTEGVEFLAGEEVRFQVTRTDGVGDNPLGNLPWIVTDGVGGFEGYYVDENTDGVMDYGIFPDTDLMVNASFGTTWFVEPQYAGATLLLTATGLDSGAVATTEFTDSTLSISGGVLTYAPVGGNTNNNVTVSYSGGVYTITDLGEAITSAPAGWTVSGNTAFGPDTGINSIVINVGNGDDIVTLLSINDPTTVNGGSSDDTLIIGNASNSLDQILAAVTFDGESSNNHLVINDQVDPTANIYSLTGSAFQRTGGPTINYSSLVDVTLNAGTGTDVVNVTPSTAVTFFINGGAPTTFPGDSLNLELSGVPSPTLSLTNSGPAYNGSWTFGGSGSNAFDPVHFTSIEAIDDAPSFSVNSVSAVETNGGTTTLIFTVTLSNAVDGNTYSIQYSTANGSATTADGDYTAVAATTLSGFTDDAPTQTFSVTVSGDNKVETDETFFVNLSNAQRTSGSGSAPLISVPTGTGTITNDDLATLSVNDISLAENGTFTFTISSDKVASHDMTVVVNTADGTATLAGLDYTQLSGVLATIAAGTSSTTVTVTVSDDAIVELNETFTVTT